MSKYFLIIIVTQLLISCTGDEKNYRAYDIELWKDTEVWDFANCISKGNFEKAESILNQEQIPIDFKDPKFGETLLRTHGDCPRVLLGLKYLVNDTKN